MDEDEDVTVNEDDAEVVEGAAVEETAAAEPEPEAVVSDEWDDGPAPGAAEDPTGVHGSIPRAEGPPPE